MVDTNLLLLWFVGSLDIKLVPEFKRTCRYVPEDYDTLAYYRSLFSRRVTTPNILTEVSNLAAQLGKRSQEFFETVFSKSIGVLEEHYVGSNSAAEISHFSEVGLTDSAIMSLARGQYLLLTDDFRLSQIFQKEGGDVVNFTHIRPINW